MKRNGKQQLALCLDNEGYPVSLEVGKLYRVVEDKDAASEGYLRVIDESGEDYAFSNNRFYIVDLPNEVRRSLIPRLEAA